MWIDLSNVGSFNQVYELPLLGHNDIEVGRFKTYFKKNSLSRVKIDCLKRLQTCLNTLIHQFKSLERLFNISASTKNEVLESYIEDQNIIININYLFLKDKWTFNNTSTKKRGV